MCEIFRMMLSRDAIITEYIGACLNDFPPFLPDAENVVLEGRKIVSFFCPWPGPPILLWRLQLRCFTQPWKARHGAAVLRPGKQLSVRFQSSGFHSGLRRERAIRASCGKNRKRSAASVFIWQDRISASRCGIAHAPRHQCTSLCSSKETKKGDWLLYVEAVGALRSCLTLLIKSTKVSKYPLFRYKSWNISILHELHETQWVQSWLQTEGRPPAD